MVDFPTKYTSKARLTIVVMLGRVCKVSSDPYPVGDEPRRFDQHAMGAAATAAPTPNTQDGAAGRGPPPPPDRDLVDPPHGCAVASLARALWPRAHGGQALLPGAQGRDLGAQVGGRASPSGSCGQDRWGGPRWRGAHGPGPPTCRWGPKRAPAAEA